MTYSKGLVILAAGNGKRLQQEIPKPLTPFFGRPLITHILDKIPGGIPIYIIINPKHQLLYQSIIKQPVHYLFQSKPEGTAHAIQCTYQHYKALDSVLVLCADTPLLPKNLIVSLLNSDPRNQLVAFSPEDPSQYGLINVSNGLATQIYESADHHAIQTSLAYSGLMEIDNKTLGVISNINACKATNEYHLTKIISSDRPFHIVEHDYPAYLFSGINTPMQLHTLESKHKEHMKNLLKENLMDPDSNLIDGLTTVDKHTYIEPNVILRGTNKIGAHCTIGSGSVIENAHIEDFVTIKPFSVISNSSIQSHCQIGPFAHIQEQSIIGPHSHIGNFVEVKRSVIGDNNKAKHLCYLGDTKTGSAVNIGAGVITCNFSPFKKGKKTTYISTNAFIGANATLIAPISIGQQAVVGAGTTLTKSVLEHKVVFNPLSLTEKD
ncbi:NTP transferase domain-containing protein [Candidatus Comchoanobacter bicostacola]|uniref:NTP transferase domain-containing protein n=1 Tax=Candidatus Comchoanobacter bicostacola TaxID=2919598 RepID=A0ABY5DJQ8_9GAMM|nr:NTP transferase domain-containing protein [Candidatus Comchoanobacter bicostacola]UTC24539.1 NTP transferase domain-containing protein [Candidatus Comchoanobacter bicostacola]